MTIEITDEGLEKREEESLKEMVESLKKEEVPEEVAINEVSKAFTFLKKTCGDLPIEDGVKCFVIAEDAESEWQREMR